MAGREGALESLFGTADGIRKLPERPAPLLVPAPPPAQTPPARERPEVDVRGRAGPSVQGAFQATQMPLGGEPSVPMAAS